VTRIRKFDLPHTGQGNRWAVGVLVSSRCAQVAAALVAAAGRGLDARVRVAGTASAEVPAETSALFAAVADSKSPSTGALVELRTRLAEVQALLVTELLAGLGVAPGRVLAVGVHDPGCWASVGGGPPRYLGLCAAAQLAESTGLNVIDGFPARDLAQGGQGGPIDALAQWVLLQDPRCNRLLLELGRTVRMSSLPPSLSHSAAARVLSFEVGPGTALLDALAWRLTGGRQSHDPGGRLAVQGRRIEKLLGHWLSDPYFARPLPRWHPRGVRPERFLADALQMAVDSGWSVRDLLCTATHFIAETVASAIEKRLPEDARIDQLIVTGGGQQNGMLLREISRTTRRSLVRISELGLPGEALGPAGIAVLALFYLDQVPANQTSVTGTSVPRLLGRLTPGSPQNWQRLTQILSGSSPAVRPLRSAL